MEFCRLVRIDDLIKAMLIEINGMLMESMFFMI